eukprot:327310-Pleurochrysis_carterae.AAC.9
MARRDAIEASCEIHTSPCQLERCVDSKPGAPLQRVADVVRASVGRGLLARCSALLQLVVCARLPKADSCREPS